MTPELEAAAPRAIAEEERRQAEPAEPHWVQFLEMGMEFAYEQGLHEIGYDPIKELRKHIVMAEESLAALRALVENEGLEAYRYLDRGIGTATDAGRRWLDARAAVQKAKP